MASWNNLPEEVLLLIFTTESSSGYNLLGTKNISECVIVCKGWKRAAQRALYRNLKFNTEKHLRNIVKVPEYVCGMVRKISFGFGKNQQKVYENYLEQLATKFPYVEEVRSIFGEEEVLYQYLIHFHLDGKWKSLKKLPVVRKRKTEYTSCALVWKDNLIELEINSFNYNAAESSISYDNRQNDRLISQLDQFKSLRSLKIIMQTYEKLQDFDPVIDKCNVLTTLFIGVYNDGLVRDRYVPTNINLKKIKSRPNITSLTGRFVIFDDTLKYIMHKFPNLKSLCVDSLPTAEKSSLSQSNVTAKMLVKYMRFLKKINDYNMDFHLSKMASYELFELIGEETQQLRISYSADDEIPSVALADDTDTLRLSLQKHSKKRRSIEGLTLYYNYSDEGLPHVELLEKFGPLLKRVDFEFEYDCETNKLNSNNSHGKDMIEGLFLDHLFKYCTNLEHLFLRYWPLVSCNPTMSKNYSITTLTLTQVKITPRVFYELSVRLVALKHLDVNFFENERESQFKIDMPYTSLETFKFTIIDELYYEQKIKAGIRISTATENLFYTYDENSEIELSESSWEAYKEMSAIASKLEKNSEACANLTIDVCCKTLKKFSIVLMSYGDSVSNSYSLDLH